MYIDSAAGAGCCNHPDNRAQEDGLSAVEVEHALSSADPKASLRSLILESWRKARDEEEHEEQEQEPAVAAVVQPRGDSSSNSDAQSARLDRLESGMAEIKNLLLNLQPQMGTGNMPGHHAALDV